MPENAVFFLPDEIEVTVPAGQTLLQAALKAGITLRGACGGKGVCGRCRVQVQSGAVTPAGTGKITPEEVAAGWVLACRTVPEGRVTVYIPEASRLTEHRVLLEEREAGVLAAVEGEAAELDPLFRREVLELSAPTLTDNTDDYGRLTWSLQHGWGVGNIWTGCRVLRDLARLLREADWRVAVDLAAVDGWTEIQGVKPAGKGDGAAYGLAVDIGTTTVAVELVNLENGTVSGRAGTYNRQAAFGDDVISRIVYATEVSGGRAELQQAVIETINGLAGELLQMKDLTPHDVRAVVCAGNTTMIHLFLGLDPTHIRLEPYVPLANVPPAVRAGELGLAVYPEAWVYCLPGVASYVGGDITAGIKVTGVAEADPLTLFLDIGTNGEMVLGNREWLVACACSAGPAFEGSGITCGMRAVAGAIEAVRVLPGGFEVVYRTVEDAKPLGICGSGLIDALSSLYQAGVIDRGGRFVRGLDTPRFREGAEGPEFVVAWGNETGHGEEIVLTQADIQNLMRAKAAIFAGFRTLLATVALEVEMVERVFIAGGFGRFINVRDAVAIGMLPDLPVERYTYVGNSSLTGARMALLSRKVWEETKEIARRVTYVELSVGNRFMEEFVSALFLPHTDMTLFPSLQKGT
ncbi:MAG: ASKHA domain-containing protein [Bacillota bacterium]